MVYSCVKKVITYMISDILQYFRIFVFSYSYFRKAGKVRQRSGLGPSPIYFYITKPQVSMQQ